uniref:Endothelial cell surface expressed chemotaxis and apoptosis regulator n=5 Tax=Canidae TaxID=9608 RepID=A0A8P0PKC5_CANLF
MSCPSKVLTVLASSAGFTPTASMNFWKKGNRQVSVSWSMPPPCRPFLPCHRMAELALAGRIGLSRPNSSAGHLKTSWQMPLSCRTTAASLSTRNLQRAAASPCHRRFSGTCGRRKGRLLWAAWTPRSYPPPLHCPKSPISSSVAWNSLSHSAQISSEAQEPPRSCCLPATDPADMGTVRAARLCGAILGFLLLQGHHSQPMTMQTSRFQGAFGKPSLITEPLSSNTGNSSSSEPRSSSSPASAGTPDTSQNITPISTTMSLRIREDSTILPSPTSETVLTVAAFGVISFIVILVVVVIILVSVVSLRFKCRKNKESEDPQKPGSSGLSESCSTANGEKDSITLISMKNINMNNSKGCPTAEKVL